MRSSKAFILGAIASAVVVWFWGKQIGDYFGIKTDGVRAQAAAGMRAVDETAGQVLDQGGASLRRAEQFLQDTKEHVSDALRVGAEGRRSGASLRRGVRDRSSGEWRGRAALAFAPAAHSSLSVDPSLHLRRRLALCWPCSVLGQAGR